MRIKSVQWMLIVACLGMAGCTAEKTTPQKSAPTETTGSTADRATEPNATGIAPEVPSGMETVSRATAISREARAEAPTSPSVTTPTEEVKKPDVIFVPTPLEVVVKMLELARVTKDDVVYDLGCGDGRIVVAAAKLGCRAYGFDVDPQRIKESRENVETNGVGDLAAIEQKDIFTLDLSKADVVTLYLLPTLNVKLIPQLEKLKPGSRIVSHDFDMRGVTPDKVVEVEGEGGYRHTVYLWTAPLKKESTTEEQ